MVIMKIFFMRQVRWLPLLLGMVVLFSCGTSVYGSGVSQLEPKSISSLPLSAKQPSGQLLLADGHTERADAVLGRYWSPEGTAIIEVYKSGDTYHGRILWDREPRYDEKNPDDSLRGRLLQGVTFLEDLSYDSDKDRWAGGTAYSPDRGRTYPSRIWLNDDGSELTVRGFLPNAPAIGRNRVYTRLGPDEQVPPQ